MKSLHLDAAKLGPSNAVFINSYMAPGLVYNSIDDYLAVSIEDLTAELVETLGLDLGGATVATTGTYTLPRGGAIKLDINVLNNAIAFEIIALTYPEMFNRIQDFVDANTYYEPRREGVYNINILHLYLDKEGNERKAAHRRDTESFDSLIVEMYPRIDVEEMMHLYSESNESNLILTGEPGTGKTCFTKMMMAAYALDKENDITVVYVKDRELLRKDSFWANIGQSRPDIIVLDDLDDELLPRSEARNDIVNNLLSYSDGIFDVETKIIITTNLTDNSIDKALVRPGRCFDILKLPHLSAAEAKSIWVDVYKAPEEDFHSRFGIDDTINVSQASLSSEFFRFTKSANPTYLRDPSISIRRIVAGE